MYKTRLTTTGSDVVDLVQNAGNTDYLVNGVIYKNAPMKMVLISAESDLTDLTDYEPGTIAYTAGFASMWQKSPAGTWTAFTS